MTVLLLSIGILSAVYFFDRKSKIDRPVIGNGSRPAEGLLIDRISENGGKQQREAEAAEKKRQQEKILASEAALSERPKSSNISFFLDSPFRGSLSIPQAWQGKYRAEESDRQLDLVYASSSGQTAKILSVYLFNGDEWLKSRKQGSYQILEALPGLVFAYQEFSGAGLSKNEAAEYLEMKGMLGDIMKSFKSQSR